MAGKVAEQVKTKSPDILFDLAPEDDKKLRESDLLDLINYGQVQKEILVPGTNGREYKVEMALLWDEDYLDILKRTTSMAADSILRVKAMRRLKLFKSIQRIDDRDYSDPDDLVSQRELWAILCRLSDIQVEYIEGKYKEIEVERDVTVSVAVQELNQKLDETSLTGKPDKNSKEDNVDQHMAAFQQNKDAQEKTAVTISEALNPTGKKEEPESGKSGPDKPATSGPKVTSSKQRVGADGK